MPKWIGNRVGQEMGTEWGSAGGVFDRFDQYFAMRNPAIAWKFEYLVDRISVSNGTIVDSGSGPGGVFTLFTSTGSVTIAPGPNLQAEYIVVGGGGGGGMANWYGAYQAGGGGGAGGFRTGTLGNVAAATTYPLTIGAGGAPPPGGPTYPNKDTGMPGTPGSPSTWNSITSEGGGAGGGGAPGVAWCKGDNGGSGGGCGGYGNVPTTGLGNMQAPNSTTPVPPQGNDGAPAPGSGGGGGAGAVGGYPPPTYNPTGVGGVGLQAFPGPLTPHIPASFGGPGPAGRWFAGGGGEGEKYAAGGGGAGGVGGGGTGSPKNTEGNAGTAGSGGGGGGAGRDEYPQTPWMPGPTVPATKNRGGTGGGGAVLIRWYPQ